MFGARSAVLRIQAASAVLVIAMVVATAGAISLAMGEALGEEVVLGTIGGLVAAVLYSQMEYERAFLAVICVITGVTTLLLLDSLLDAVVGLEP